MKKDNKVSKENSFIAKKQLKAVDEASTFAENIINTVREPLLVLDKDLRVVKVNRSFYDFIKVSPDETIGTLIYALGNQQWNIPKLRELLETILPEKTTFDNYVVEHDFSTIGKRIMLLNARQIERAFGKEKIILLAIEDITERKKIEDGLEKTRNELVVIKKSADEAGEFSENIINTVREPLLLLDKKLRVVKASRSFYDFFKVNSDETIGTLIYDLGNKQWDIPKLRELLETILPEKTTFENYEVEHDFSTIGKRTMLLNARQIERAFRKEKIILLAIEDITVSKNAEEKLKKTFIELKRSNEELEQFAYIASHDLQEPLRMVASYTQLLERKYKDKLDKDAIDFIGFAVDGANRMQCLINDLLEFSRITLRGKELEMVSLSEAFSAAIFSLQHTIQETHAIILNDELPMVKGDLGQLMRVFQNLIDNAIKFKGAKTPIINIKAKEEGEKIVISVEDNGIGIDSKYKERVFVIFQRLNNRTEYKGTGIGLAICKRTIERHGGKIWFESEIGKGTTFYFTLNK